MRICLGLLAALLLGFANPGHGQAIARSGPDAGDPPFAGTPAQAIAPTLADSAVETISLEEERNRRYTIPVMVEGAGPYNFMIDTGSQATAVTHEINQKLNLRSLGIATLVGMASQRPVQVVAVDNLTFGSRTVYDLNAPVLERTHVGADGIIGLDTLQDFRVMIDFRAETIAVEDATANRDYRSGYEIVVRARQKLGQLLITNAIVEGIRTTVIIDTGAQASLANNALRDRIRTKRAEEVTTTDVNGVSLVGQMSYVRSLTIEGLALTNVPLTFADAPAFAALGLKDTPVLALGMEHLKLFDRVAIDFARNRILFDLPRDAARTMRRTRLPR